MRTVSVFLIVLPDNAAGFRHVATCFNETVIDPVVEDVGFVAYLEDPGNVPHGGEPPFRKRTGELPSNQSAIQWVLWIARADFQAS
jgi:hypothetical protein